MGRLFLGYETAYWIWRKAGRQAFSMLTPSRVRSLAGGAPSQDKVQAFLREHPDLVIGDLDVVVQYSDRRNALNTREHVCSRPLPDRSFYRLDDEVYVASPELCLMQLAQNLTVAQVLKLALEMCGSYAIDPLADDEEGFTKRPPLTSAKKLKAYAARLYSQNSRAKSAQFLRWVTDNSASPRETALFMLLCMPPRFGGYGIEIPELNKRINLTLEEQFMVGVHHFDCDAYWSGCHVALEYDSARHHTALEKQERDAIRRNMLQHKGIQVIVATRLQLDSANQFDKLGKQVARAVGKRLRIPEKEHVVARDQLRKTLFSWDLFPARFGDKG